MSAIEFQGVSKRYGDRAAVDGLSFRIEEGERVVVHGPSGCGKTTVLRLVAGFLAPDVGKVLVGGKVVASDGTILISPEHRHLGMVFQDLALWPHLTVAQNLDFALKAQGLAAEIRRQADHGHAGARPAQRVGGRLPWPAFWRPTTACRGRTGPCGAAARGADG